MRRQPLLELRHLLLLFGGKLVRGAGALTTALKQEHVERAMVRLLLNGCSSSTHESEGALKDWSVDAA